METSIFPGKAGVYNLQVASWLPRLKVSVFKHSIHESAEWRMRCAGLVVDPGKILERGHWEGPLPSR